MVSGSAGRIHPHDRFPRLATATRCAAGGGVNAQNFVPSVSVVFHIRSSAAAIGDRCATRSVARTGGEPTHAETP